ncbi:MAG TPA: glycosyltransferase family 2 protein [Geothrix sp.]|jgi:glycosyltransferase involved in cell wall biosynthesis
MTPKKLISIISPAYNEEGNIRRCYEEVKAVMAQMSDRYDYEHIFGDNCSSDRTLDILREIAAGDHRVKVLTYTRNWGAEKNSVTLLRHALGDAVVPVLSDLQDPPHKIPSFIDLWENGFEIIFGTYINHADGIFIKPIRHLYYKVVRTLSGEEMVDNHSGFGLYDRRVVDEILKVDDFNPHIRGVIASMGFKRACEPYERRKRVAGISSYNFGRYLDTAINSIVSYSLVPIRLATILGLCLSGISFLLAIAYAVIKLFNWNFQAPGATTIVVLILFFAGIQLLFLGVIGEYVSAIHGQVRRKPFVVIREKINFDRS